MAYTRHQQMVKENFLPDQHIGDGCSEMVTANWVLIATNKRTGDAVVVGPFAEYELAIEHARIHFKEDNVVTKITVLYPGDAYKGFIHT